MRDYLFFKCYMKVSKTRRISEKSASKNENQGLPLGVKRPVREVEDLPPL
jgi:hypothetical protein